jgi:hypothetical protein
MGVVICKDHGRQAGSLVCEHVLSATTHAVQPEPTIVRFLVDPLNDGTLLSDHYVCTACAQRFSLAAGAKLTGEEWEESEKLPHLGLACHQCLEKLTT